MAQSVARDKTRRITMEAVDELNGRMKKAVPLLEAYKRRQQQLPGLSSIYPCSGLNAGAND